MPFSLNTTFIPVFGSVKELREVFMLFISLFFWAF